jgi:hypothetical protein
LVEGAGEDPFLGSAMAAAYVRGYQGSRLDAPDSIAACLKHYVGYGAAEGDAHDQLVGEVLAHGARPPARLTDAVDKCTLAERRASPTPAPWVSTSRARPKASPGSSASARSAAGRSLAPGRPTPADFNV